MREDESQMVMIQQNMRAKASYLYPTELGGNCIFDAGTMTVHVKKGVASSTMIIHVEQSRKNLAKEVLQISNSSHSSRVEGD